MFGTVLIANRGEIARRVIRTCRRLGIRTVAVHEAGDDLHAREADEARLIDSYLSVESIVAAGAGCDAVHPGYGFLSENAAFARACREAGLVFIGPSPEAIEAVGDKVRARELAVTAGVPVVPEGTEGGYPVMVKAAAGGGGRGMRVVHAEAELEDAVASARREAAAGFGDDRVFIEKYVERARHIEVQMLGTIAVGERECSLQRRHQKVIEEAPALIPDDLRESLLREASAVAAAAGYENAGTVEFIVNADDPGEHYFLEMNARLQVEHPVTELVTGLDLVECQLLIAAGEALPFERVDVRGHAIEARVTAENAEWLPQTGTVLRYAVPGDVRVDAGIEEGTEVSGRYDSLLAKVIAYGADRDEAVARLDRALAETTILGVHSSVPNLRRLLEIPVAEFHTERVAELETQPHPRDAEVARAAAAVEFAELGVGDGWRLGGVRAPSWWLLEVEGGEPETVVLEAGTLPEPGWTHAREPDGTLWLGRDGHAWRVREPSIEEAHQAAGDGAVKAPMPGQVLAVDVAEGDAVTAGQRLVVLESMKMELSLTSPIDGAVTSLAVKEGDRVKEGEALVTVE